jgi:hypothetical protein
MIDTLLSKIAGFFEKDFLFASFLPALIFITALVITVAGVISIEAVWEWVDSWTAMQKASAAIGGTLLVVVVAYVLQALRTSFTRGWTGNSHSIWLWGIQNLGVLYQKRRYRRRQAASQKQSPWRDVFDEFNKQLLPIWSRDLKGTPPPPGSTTPQDTTKEREPLPERQRASLTSLVESLRVTMQQAAIKDQLREVVEAYKLYSGDDLADIYRALKDKLTEWNDDEEARIQTETYNLDRWFGRLPSVKATTLGNVIQAYNYYPFKRYKIEPDIFWPRLRKVITPEYLSQVQESRILLDFLLTMATLSGLYALLDLIVGPWLWFNLWLWLSLAAVGFSISFFFYKLSIGAAFELGEMVRSCFDLFRLDLMTALHRPAPATLAAEQVQWDELSRLAVYGFKTDFTLAAKPPATGSQ